MRGIVPLFRGSWIVILLFADALPVRADEPPNLLKNPGAETTQNGQPADWFAAKAQPRGLRMSRATERSHSGKASLAIAIDKAVPNTFSNWVQELRAVRPNTTLRLSAFVKTERAEEVIICVQCWSRDSKMLAFAGTPEIPSDQDWTKVECQPVVVPLETATITVRAGMTGKGKVWFDDLTLIAEAPRPAEPDPALAQLVPGRIVKTVSITKDRTVLNYLPDWDHGDVDNLALQNTGGGVRLLLAWPTLAPQDTAPPARRYYLALHARKAIAPGPAEPVEIFEVTADWPERTSWKTQPPTAPKPSTTATLGPGEGWKLIEITPLLRAPAQPPAHGLLLKFAHEDHPDPEMASLQFASREAQGEWSPRRPVLLIVDPAVP
jgi:hypothetical protein